ncbi:unnamed protein product, partial [Amoebophrya sp. A120]
RGLAARLLARFLVGNGPALCSRRIPPARPAVCSCRVMFVPMAISLMAGGRAVSQSAFTSGPSLPWPPCLWLCFSFIPPSGRCQGGSLPMSPAPRSGRRANLPPGPYSRIVFAVMPYAYLFPYFNTRAPGN